MYLFFVMFISTYVQIQRRKVGMIMRVVNRVKAATIGYDWERLGIYTLDVCLGI